LTRGFSDSWPPPVLNFSRCARAAESLFPPPDHMRHLCRIRLAAPLSPTPPSLASSWIVDERCAAFAFQTRCSIAEDRSLGAAPPTWHLRLLTACARPVVSVGFFLRVRPLVRGIDGTSLSGQAVVIVLQTCPRFEVDFSPNSKDNLFGVVAARAAMNFTCLGRDYEEEDIARRKKRGWREKSEAHRCE